MNNNLQMMQALRNPQQFVQSMISKSRLMNNPTLRNAVNMGNNGDFKGAEQLARNLCRENNIDPDQAIRQLMSQLGMK